ncbi:MAG TPA: protein kinase, partial [Sandaracinaceae bacterium]
RVLGTPAYMSPEAARRRPLGPASDLYSLGVLLFEMIVGEPPFKTGDAGRTLRAHITTPAPRLREAAPWLFVPEALEALVAELLEKDPARRPHDAGEVARRLERIAAELTLEGTVRKRRAEIESAPPPPLAADDDAERTRVWTGSPIRAVPAPPPRDRASRLLLALASLGPARTAAAAFVLGLLAFVAVFALRHLS